MLAMVVNDDAGHQVYRRVLATIASMLAPTGGAVSLPIPRRFLLRADVAGLHDRVELLRIATLLT
ncbi:hypothetical protein DM828_26080 [Pseudomonas umsongensis]|jgi:hypothetical protein|nr:hypothetical protein [Pseudomonas umsongensis]